MTEPARTQTTRDILTPMNYQHGLNRLFVVFVICWYIGGGFVLWPKWSRALDASRYAEHLRTNSRNADGTYTAFEDEIATGVEGKPKDPDFTISPMRFLALGNAEVEANVLRPIKETVLCAILPIGVYLMALAAGWVYRGFKPGTQI